MKISTNAAAAAVAVLTLLAFRSSTTQTNSFFQHRNEYRNELEYIPLSKHRMTTSTRCNQKASSRFNSSEYETALTPHTAVTRRNAVEGDVKTPTRGSKEEKQAAAGNTVRKGTSGKDDVVLEKAKQGTVRDKENRQAARGAKEDTQAAGDMSESEEDGVVLDTVRQALGGEASNNIASSMKIQFCSQIIDIDELWTFCDKELDMDVCLDGQGPLNLQCAFVKAGGKILLNDYDLSTEENRLHNERAYVRYANAVKQLTMTKNQVIEI